MLAESDKKKYRNKVHKKTEEKEDKRTWEKRDKLRKTGKHIWNLPSPLPFFTILLTTVGVCHAGSQCNRLPFTESQQRLLTQLTGTYAHLLLRPWSGCWCVQHPLMELASGHRTSDLKRCLALSLKNQSWKRRRGERPRHHGRRHWR